MVIMRIINNYNLGSGDSSKTRLVAIEEPPIRKFNVHNSFVIYNKFFQKQTKKISPNIHNMKMLVCS